MNGARRALDVAAALTAAGVIALAIAFEGARPAPLATALFVLLLFQLPLAYSLANRLQRGHEERERLLTSAIEASSAERRRIASDLHDGVVQDLAGVAFGLAPLAEDATRPRRETAARTNRSPNVGDSDGLLA